MAVPVTIWSAPSVVSATAVLQDAIPLSGSEHPKLTVAPELFQPAASGGGAMVPEITGGVLSRLTVTEVVALFPALSVTVPDTTWCAPSFVSKTGEGQDATPLVLSKQVKLTVTFVLFQPAAFGAGLMVPEIEGGPKSKLII